MKPLKILIDASVGSKEVGSMEQFIIGLISGLAEIDGDEEFFE